MGSQGNGLRTAPPSVSSRFQVDRPEGGLRSSSGRQGAIKLGTCGGSGRFVSSPRFGPSLLVLHMNMSMYVVPKYRRAEGGIRRASASKTNRGELYGALP